MMNDLLEARTIDRYMKELDRELQDLPRDRRREITSEISAHITSALAEIPSPTESDLRNVLDRLGEPAEIAEEARERFGISRRKASFGETAAVLLLPVGGLILPLIGWIVGVVFLWTSDVWTLRDKLIGTLILPGGVALPLYLSLTSSTICASGSLGDTTCSSSSAIPQVIGVAAWVILLIAPFVSAFYLSRRLNERTAD